MFLAKAPSSFQSTLWPGVNRCVYSLFKSKTLVSSSKSYWFSKGNNLPGVRLQGQGDQYKFQILHSPGKITEPVKSPCSSVSPSRVQILTRSLLFLSCLYSLGCVSMLRYLTLWTGAHQAPLSTGFSRQEYWSGLLYLSPGDLPDSGIKPVSLALAGEFFTAEPPEKPALVVEEPFCWSTLFSVRIAPCVAVFLMCSSEELSSVSS